MAHRAGHELIPAAPDRRVARVFLWYARRMARKRFHALRLTRGSMDILRTLASEPRPVLVALNHASWWDPLIGAFMADRFAPGRSHLAPMDAQQLRRFGVFRKLGVFGIDPDEPSSIEAMLTYVLERFKADPLPTLWITPQGEFTDVRDPVRPRPGLAGIAARLQNPRVLSVAIEYTFWQDARPEVFVQVTEVPGPPSQVASPAAPSVTLWHRAITAAMQANADALAGLVRARDPAPFADLLGGPDDAARMQSRIHPVYDWYLRLRRKSGSLTTGAQRREQAALQAVGDPASSATPARRAAP